MDGWEATRQIRQWELENCILCRNSSEDFCPHKRLPIVAVTADVVVKTRSMCFSSGMDDYITKVTLSYSKHSPLALLYYLPLSFMWSC